MSYLDSITEYLSLDNEEEKELKKEWYQHLEFLMNDFINKGVSRNEAIQLSINQFGEPNMLRTEVNKNFLSPRRLHLLKELFVWSICLIAASIGPVLLINAHYSVFFVSGPLVYLAICYGIYTFVVRKLYNPYLRIIGMIFCYSYFAYLGSQISLKHFISELMSLNFGGDGLFTISVIHLLWITMIITHVSSNSLRKQKIFSLIRASFEYWLMLFLAIVIVRTEILTNSGEGKVMILNIFLLYAFLQQVIDPRFLIKSRNIVKYWLKV